MAMTKEERRRHRAAQRKENAEYLRKVKEADPCIDCKEHYPYYVMDYDHRDETTKKNDVSSIANQLSLKMVKEEIAKCDLVCANCHRKRTHLQGHC
jgi:hypothetical protein